MVEHTAADISSKTTASKNNVKKNFNNMSNPKKVIVIILLIILVVLIIAASGFGIRYIIKNRNSGGATTLHLRKSEAPGTVAASGSGKAASVGETEEVKVEKSKKKGHKGQKKPKTSQTNLLGINDIRLVSMESALAEKQERSAK